MKRRAAALLIAGVLALTGCATGSPSPATHGGHDGHPVARSGAFNETDVMFLQMLVPHHEQGLTIVRLGKDRATREDIRTLAAAIESTQADEVQAMSGWLRDWAQPPTAPPDSHAAHGGLPGTTPTEIANLEKATGQDFDRRFLNMMIAHQDDAIQIAKMETTAGTNPQARDLADRIDRSRSAQIQQMLGYLA